MKQSVLLLLCSALAEAHVGVFTDGMFCRGGNDFTTDDQNTNLVVNPLYNLTKSQWWMQADRGCDKVPPPEGEFLDLPAGGSFTVELAINRAFTTLSYGGDLASDWPDGLDHPEDWSAPDEESCLMDNPDGEGGPLHTKSEEASAGTAWAISYEEDLSAVTMENLVVFSVLEHTPWKRLATYDVPKDMPPCPEQGCYCAWLWVPDGCGEPNMYMQNFRCRVTNTSSTKKLGVAQVPVPCVDDPASCVSGPKQMIAWNQAEGNNVGDIGFSPAYSSKMGYLPGAQNDIFEDLETGDGNDSVGTVEPSGASSVVITSPSTSTTASSNPATSTSIASPVVSDDKPVETTPSKDAEEHHECASKKLRRRRRARTSRASRSIAPSQIPA